jgi:hypothetical protein
MPSFCNSPWIRGAPHIALAAHIFRIDLESLGLYQVFPVGTDGSSMSNKAEIPSDAKQARYPA